MKLSKFKNGIIAVIAIGIVAVSTYAKSNKGNQASPVQNPITRELCNEYPELKACVSLKYCDQWPNSSECAGSIPYCDKWPNSSECVGSPQYCDIWPNSTECLGTPQYCKIWPHDSSCKQPGNLCENNPNHPDCHQTNQPNQPNEQNTISKPTPPKSELKNCGDNEDDPYTTLCKAQNALIRGNCFLDNIGKKNPVPCP